MWLEIATTFVAILGLIAGIVRAGPACLFLAKIRRLCDVRGAERFLQGVVPRVSVIVPARDEEAAIQQCLESLACQDYPNLEIIAVDDRSTDATGRKMDRAAADHRGVEVIHVESLPAGWLGKNHANDLGARKATGDWLLFTDGDILFRPDTVRLAMAHAGNEDLDHLTLYPGLLRGGYWETAMCCFFLIMFSAHFKPWQARNPLRPQSFCGVGAFNLVRRDAYAAIGTHERLRLEVADDIKLAKLLKHSGFVSDIMSGRSGIEVRWQVGALGVIKGLEKNAFGGADYRIGPTILGLAFMLCTALLPLVGMLFAPGWAKLPFALWQISLVAMLGHSAAKQGHSPLIGLAFPVACLLMFVAVLRSMVLTLARGGVEWRGTFYPLAELRRGIV